MCAPFSAQLGDSLERPSAPSPVFVHRTVACRFSPYPEGLGVGCTPHCCVGLGVGRFPAPVHPSSFARTVDRRPIVERGWWS